ncbi:MAG: diguanylate phosphodiesterase [Nitrospirae bacterium CG17_big_fil_post_rev_8_21_14_2_50_50_9]|nr:MAG: diguanylate phosphodiesterase [Nitrospirae bacterium CG17_big_fil_post_rev_8_21_14_2_50_50_9]
MTEKKIPGEWPRHKGEEFLQVFYKGAEFTKELMDENEKLRYRIMQMQEQIQTGGEDANLHDRLAKMEQEIKALADDKERLLKRHEEVEKENKDFADRYIVVQEENNNLANLYIASHQLHSTLDYKEVLRIVLEIVINLVGAETFCLMLLDEKHNEMATVAAEGIEVHQVKNIKIGQGIIGEVAKTGESYFSESTIKRGEIDLEKPVACVPLKIKESVIGLLVIYSLLVQKEQFKNIDYELFNLLASHAATAIYSAKLYSQSERKLSTIQGFLDLLTETPERKPE